MRERKRPKFRSWTENVDEALAIARGNFGAIGYANEVGMFIRTEATVEFFARGNGERVNGFAGLGSKESELNTA